MAPRWDPETYLKYRPRYSDELYNRIIAYGGLEQGSGLAVDVGCGSGQVAIDLANKFPRVVAIDPSQDQLAAAIPHPNIEYRVGTAEATDIPDNTADVITAAAALHWFQQESFFKEAKRVLRPGGVVACWCYNSHPLFPGDSEAAARAYTRVADVFWPYMDPRLHSAMRNGYSVHLPAAQAAFHCAEMETYKLEWNASVDSVVGWLRSWSSYITFSEKHGAAAAETHLADFARELTAATGVDSESDPLRVILPLDLLLAK